MDIYLEQFKKLPKELQEAVSSEEKVKNLDEIEKKYNLKLAKLVVHLMIKDILWLDLENFLISEFKLTPEKAKELKKDLAEKIFSEVIGYLEKPRIEIEKEKIEEKLIETAKDELELEKAAEEAKVAFVTPPVIQLPVKSLEEIVSEIKVKKGLTFTDKILEKRFENIVLNFLREVRKDFETEEILTRSEKIGGMGMTLEKAREIIDFLKDEKKKLIEIEKLEIKRPEIKKPELAEGILRPEEIVKGIVEEMPIKEPKLEIEKEKIETLEKKPEVKIDEELKKRFDGGTITPIFKKLEKPIKVKEMPIESPTETERKEVKEKKLEVGEIPIQIRRPITEEKLVEDVSIKPRVFGPIDELKEITLRDLKRWGGKQTCQIIFNKINLLAEESLIKKAKGIKAWQKSALYNLYLEIGHQALEKKKTVAEIISERISQGKETISLEDFEEITDLNKKLHF